MLIIECNLGLINSSPPRYCRKIFLKYLTDSDSLVGVVLLTYWSLHLLVPLPVTLKIVTNHAFKYRTICLSMNFKNMAYMWMDIDGQHHGLNHYLV